MFMDPRTGAKPPFTGSPPEPSSDPKELIPLVALCREGRIYDVERWIQEGKPIHARVYRGRGARRIDTPLEIAIATNQYDLALLLLCNGFPPDSGDESPLDLALREKKLNLFELLLAWGADPLRADLYEVLSTYDSDLYERCWRLGMDFTREHALAHTLSDHSSNRPAYGWARRHKDDERIARELAIALHLAIVENRERAVALLVWACADPHRRAPDIRWSYEEDEDEQSTAINLAVLYGRGQLLPTLKPNVSQDDFERLWADVCDPESIDYLAKIQRPQDFSGALIRNLRQVVAEYGDHTKATECVEKLTVSHGARLTTVEPETAASLRRDILKCRDEGRCRWVLRWMSYSETCEPAIYEELTRTSSMRAKVEAVHVHDLRYR
jgi:hypothetical protein